MKNAYPGEYENFEDENLGNELEGVEDFWTSSPDVSDLFGGKQAYDKDKTASIGKNSRSNKNDTKT